MTDISIRIEGTDAQVARLGAMSGSMRSYVGQVIFSETEEVKRAAAVRMAELFKNPETMQAALSTDHDDDGKVITGTVTASGLPYLAIQEFGGVTSPHDIFPVNGTALAFFGQASAAFKTGQATGGQVFAKAVHHPGSVMPERSYLRYALALRRSSILAALFAAVDRGAREGA